MTKMKTFLGAVIALLAVGAVACVPASATGWMINGSELAGSTNLANTASVVWGKMVLKFEGVTITCTAPTLKGKRSELTAPNEGSVESLEFTGCVAPEPCKLTSSTIKTQPIMFVASVGVAPAATASFLPTTGTLFAEIPFTDLALCPFKGKFPLTGTVKVGDPKGQEEATWQTITSEATEASGELKLGTSAATLEGSLELKLENSEPWSFL